jgi:hypothetical protein
MQSEINKLQSTCQEKVSLIEVFELKNRAAITTKHNEGRKTLKECRNKTKMHLEENDK